MRRSLSPTSSAAEGRIELPRVAPKVPSAHITPVMLGGSRFQLHEHTHHLCELPGHRHHSDGRAFPPLREPLVVSMEKNLHLPGDGKNLRRLLLAAAIEVGPHGRMVAIVPGSFHEHSPHMSIVTSAQAIRRTEN